MATQQSFFRSAFWLALCVVTTAMLMLPVAWTRSGLNGPLGLLGAAVLVLLCGWAAEAVAWALGREKSPAGALLGMAVRMLPPLGLCAILAAQGAKGREFLPFIGYLLVLYLVTLALETCISVRRIAAQASGVAKPIH